MNISFIIPCYNCEKTIKQTVKSILRLKLKDFEICMVDDGSTDNTKRILDKYKIKYADKIKIGSNKENMGGGYTRNECYKMAKYNWIFLIDSDNYLEKKSFFKLIDSVDEKKDKMLSFHEIVFFIDFLGLDLIYKKWISLKNFMEFKDMRKTQCTPVSDGNYLYKREVFDKINGYDTDVGALDSWSFGYKALLAGYKFRFVDGTKIFHRVNPKSYWMREKRNNNENLKKLLLKYSSKFSEKEKEQLRLSSDVLKILHLYDNDIIKEYINPLFRIPIKIYYKLFKI